MKSHLFRLFSYLSPHRTVLFLGAILLVSAKGLEAAIPYLLGKLTNTLLSVTEGGNPKEILSWILPKLGELFLILLGISTIEIGIIKIKNRIGKKALMELRREVYQKIISLPISYFNKERTGKVMTRVVHDVDQLHQMFAESAIPLIGGLCLFFFSFCSLFLFDARLGAIMCVLFIPLSILINHFRINQRRCYGIVRECLAKMNGFVQEHLLGMSTIRSFGLEAQEKKKFDQHNDAFRSANLETIHYFSLFFAGIDWLQNLALIAVFVLLFQSPHFNGGTFFAFSLYLLLIFRPLADLTERYNVLQAAAASAERLFTLLDLPPEKDEGSAKLDQIHSVRFQDVWFAYNDEEWILKGCTFSLLEKSSTALVGQTGAGKSTLFNLLLGFYHPQKGEIFINEQPLSNYSLKELRKQISVILQDPEIFSGTIQENITLFSEDAILLDKPHPILQKHTILKERGRSLSAGEKQLLSIERAIYHNRSLLLLDEATANIDQKTEQEIQTSLSNLLTHQAALIIAHRLSTIKHVDRIIVLDQGVVAEEGNHDTLIKKDGIYKKLYLLQTANLDR